MFFPQFGVQPYPQQGETGVASFNARTGVVIPAANDYNAGQVAETADRSFSRSVASIAALKALAVAGVQDGSAALVRGYHAEGDGGGGPFFYDAGSSAADDGGTVIAPTAGSGRWRRVYSGPANVRWFGAKGDGTTDDTAAVQAALSTAKDVYVPAGTYSVTSLVISNNQRLCGTSYIDSVFAVKSYGTYVAIKYGVLCRGHLTSPSNADISYISDVKFQIDSNEAAQVGLLITRRMHLERVYINEAPGDGVYFRSVNEANEAPYFCRLTEVRSAFSGGSGFKITENCTNISLYNCQGRNSAEHGLHQVGVSNGQPTLMAGLHVENGQYAYNQKHGIFIENGYNSVVINAYYEVNSASDTSDVRTGAYKHVALGATVQYTYVLLGSLGVAEVDALGSCSWNAHLTNTLYMGGNLLSGLNNTYVGAENSGGGKTLTFRAATGSAHNVLFRVATWDAARVRFAGSTGSIALETSADGTTFTSGVRYSYQGKLGFYNAEGVVKPTVTGSRGANAALASLLTALANLGLLTDSSS